MEKDSSSGTTDPNSRPMVEASAPPPPKKRTNNWWIIVGCIIGAIVLIGIVVAVAISATAPKPDSFSLALQKLFSKEESRNTRVDGSVNLEFADTSSVISEIQLDIDSQIVKDSSVNDTKIEAEIKLDGGETINPTVEGIFTDSGDIYLKPGGLANGFAKIIGYSYESVPQDNPIIEFINEIDNKWLAISADEMEELDDLQSNMNANFDKRPIVCTSSLMSDINNNFNSIIEIYKSHPFIRSTQEDLVIAKKANPIYKVTIDESTLIAFLNDFANTEPANNFARCNSIKKFPSDKEFAEKLLSAFPDIYLEIDDDYDITRLYSEFAFGDSDVEVTVDLDFSFPDIVNIVEPVEYESFSELLERLADKLSALMSDGN